MSIFSVILPNNQVRRIDYSNIGIFVKDLTHVTVIDGVGETIVNKGNPITWPTNATNGLQAIVDVKAGTLRFGHDEMINPTEFVVSEYDESDTLDQFTSIEDAQPEPHIFDVINYWPQAEHECVASSMLPEGWMWKYFGDDWVLSNGTIGLKREDWFKYNNKQVAAQPIGTKADSGKPMMGCIPPHAELAVARVLTFGAQKYSRGNWAHVENSDERYMDAALRHINAYRRGENTDTETGESHLAHAICCLLFILENSEMS